MKMMNRFMLSSTLLVFLSLVALLAAFAVIASLLTPENGGKEMLDSKVYLSAKTIEKFDASTEKWESLNSQLTNYDYNLLVIKEDETVFSTLNTSQTAFINSLKSLALGSNTHLGKINGVSFAAYALGDYSLFAVNNQSKVKNAEEFSIEVISPFIGFCLIAIAIILIFSQLFARILARRFLRPLNALSEGAKRIENGDLSKSVDYNG